MKTFKLSYLIILAGFLAVLLMFSSCSDSSTGPDIDDTTQIDDPTDDEPGAPIDPPPSDNFKIDSDDVTETDDGYRFNGSLVGINGNGIEFEIGEGEFDVTLDANGVIISISGRGLPEFPDIGIYKEILEDFAWDKIESHILYNKGSYFLNEYNTEVPLNPDRYYITYRVFDESKDGNFKLRGRANDLIHGFNEVYIDIDDPAVFLKFQLWKPKGGTASVAEKFWKRAFENAKAVGQIVGDYTGAPNMIVGLSNNGTFNTPEYALGLENSQAFEDLYGFNRMESLPANMFLGLKGVPIPKTGVLQLHGHVYVHNPLIASIDGEGNIDSVVDWFNEFTTTPASASFAGSMDFGRKGIEFILTGVLPGVNDVVGRDIFNDDFDLDLISGFMQEYNPYDGSQDEYFRLGGTIRRPLIADIFGPNIQQYLVSQPGVDGYMYLDVGYDLDRSSLFLEQAQRIIIPGYGEVDLTNSHFRINSDGFNFHAHGGVNLGPLELNRSLSGMFTKDGYELTSIFERDITLPNDVVLGNREMLVSVSSNSGATLEGQIILPFSMGEAAVSGQVSDEGLTMSGMMSTGSQLALDTGLNLPTRDFEMTVSTDPVRILELHGETQMPFIGYNRMTGIINRDHFLFDGEIDRTLSFGTLSVPISNGKLTIDSREGLFLDGNIDLPHLGSAELSGEISDEQIMFKGAVNRNLSFSGVSLEMANGDILLNNDGARLSGTLDLPSGLRTADVSGSITESGMNLSGNMRSSVRFHNVDFPISSSTVTASTNSGVTADFRMNLFRYTQRLRGSISPSGNFELTGSRNFSRSINAAGQSATFNGSINTRLRNSGVHLSGSGSISYTGLLGNTIEIASGPISFNPNWSSGTIEACISGYCVDI